MTDCFSLTSLIHLISWLLSTAMRSLHLLLGGINAIKTGGKVGKKDRWRGVGCYFLQRTRNDRKQKHSSFTGILFSLACELCDFLFDPVFVQSISVSECWRCGCTHCLSTAHTTSVENGHCVLRLMLCTLLRRAWHRNQTHSVTSNLHSSIFSYLLYFLTLTWEYNRAKCDVRLIFICF